MHYNIYLWAYYLEGVHIIIRILELSLFRLAVSWFMKFRSELFFGISGASDQALPNPY